MMKYIDLLFNRELVVSVLAAIAVFATILTLVVTPSLLMLTSRDPKPAGAPGRKRWFGLRKAAPSPAE